MKNERFTFHARDGVEIVVRAWLPENAKAVCQIAHGMAEHSGRYHRFAEMLVDAGYGVYASDHRGHGETAGHQKNLGFFAEQHGWDSVVADMRQLTEIILENHPGRPVFLFGHSMGALLSTDYISQFGGDLRGVLLSAPAKDPGLLGNLGIMLAKIERRWKGSRTPSPMLDNLTFGSFNKAFKPNRTDFDWLTRDDAEVDRYVADPYCGTVFTTGFFVDLLTGVKKINQSKTIDAIPKNLSILILAGEEDPVGNRAKSVFRLQKALEKAQIADVNHIVYPHARHELLNEINREEVYRDIVAWLNKRN